MITILLGIVSADTGICRNTYTINTNVFTNNGRISVNPVVENINGMAVVPAGTNVVLSFINERSYSSRIIEIDGSPITVPDNTYTIYNVSGDHTAAVGFFPSGSSTHTVTPNHSGPGVILPAGSVTVAQGTSVTFRFIPDRGYTYGNVIIDGEQRVYGEVNGTYHGAGPRVLFESISDDHSFSVEFLERNSSGYRTLRDLRLWDSGDFLPGGVISPDTIHYKGAFRVPSDYADFQLSWNYNAGGLVYYSGGDPNGPDDGYPGSLFGTGHVYQCAISEISIPEPVISESHILSELNSAQTFQPFTKVDGEMGNDMLIGGLAHLPKQGVQSEGRLYFGKGKHFPDQTASNHGWVNLDLHPASTKGLWKIGDIPTVNTGYMLFEIPSDWATQHTSGRILATGRNRWGQGTFGHGPSLYAIAPWESGTPPAPDTPLDYTTLIQYSGTDESTSLQGYRIADTWSGGAWLTKGADGAILFAAQISYGPVWYGMDYATGNMRGMFGINRKITLQFFNPGDLAKVADVLVDSHTPQPYAVLDITPYLWADYATRTIQESGNHFLIAYDRERSYLFIPEKNIDGNKPIIHVFEITERPGGVKPPPPSRLRLGD